jgi:hypothetical protein
MKQTTSYCIASLLLAYTFVTNVSFAHDIIVHEQITLYAIALERASPSSPYNSFLNTISGDIGPFLAMNGMRLGSALEDNADAPGDVGKKRSLNHFYDPVYYQGLTDTLPVTSFYSLLEQPVGQPSFTWASVSNCSGIDFAKLNTGTSNIWSWPNARGYEYIALSSSSPITRTTNFGNMFRAIGQVVHLLEDTSQPEHVRNEMHLDYWPTITYSTNKLSYETPWHSRFEDYGQANWQSLNYSTNILNWRGLGFNKMQDFWDRHLYVGSVTALYNDEAGDPGSQLGLAEFVNGNFLGERHLYRDYFVPGSISWYPYPSLITSTDYMLKKSYLNSGIGNYKLHNGYLAKGIYLRKETAGINVSHHSRFTYLGVKHPAKMTSASTTIRDDTVLADYHAILIPKAVQYSAGLIDYFFRGNLGVSATNIGGTYSLTITNTSPTNFSGGQFHLFYDDASGTRAELIGPNFSTTYSPSSGLAAGSPVTGTFTPSAGSSNYLVVFQGSIGTSGTTALDPVDAGIAIAAAKFNIQPPTGSGCTHPNPVSGLTWWFNEFGGTIAGGDVNLSENYSDNPVSAITTVQASDEDYVVTITINYTLHVFEDSRVDEPLQVSQIFLIVGGVQVDMDELDQVDNSDTCESKSGQFVYSFSQHAAGPATDIQLKQDGVGQLNPPFETCQDNSYVVTIRPLCPP